MEKILRQREALNDIMCSHIGFEILRDHIFDLLHQLLRREESQISETFSFILQSLVDAMHPEGIKRLPRELLSSINALDHQILALELDMSVLTYHQLQTVLAFLLDHA